MAKYQKCKRRLVIVNQVLGPLMCQLLGDLTRGGIECEAITGWADLPADQPVTFRLSKAAKLVKHPSWRRLLTWSAFTLQAVGRLAVTSSPAMISTNPPWTMLLAPWLNRIFGLQYVLLVYDVYPDVMERMGLTRPGSLLSRTWRRLSRHAMVHAAGVITLGTHMAATLQGHLRPGDRVNIDVIPNWADTEFIHPIPKSENPFVSEHGLVDKMVVTYSGAFGKTHDTESIILAAELLQDISDIHFMLIGRGTREQEVRKMVAEKNLPNLTLLGLQPWEMLPYSLAASDCCIVCLDEGYEGVSVPSKTYYALAAGAAILAVSAKDTELADMVAKYPCGKHIPPRNPQALADAVRQYHDNPQRGAAHRHEARRLAENRFSRVVATKQYAEYLNKWFW
jgi:glycosyltransferase involved in cell wall biosynthesis